MKNGSLQKLIFCAMCIALCVVLPMAFHSFPNGGTVFSPMHIPVLLCGLACGWPFGLVTGLLGPLLSSLLTSMPPAAILPSMMAECAVYGLLSGVLMQLVHTGRLYPDLYLSMVTAMLTGRIAAGLLKAFLFAPGQMTLRIWAGTYFVTGLPGLVIQLAVVPALVAALMKAKLIPNRY